MPGGIAIFDYDGDGCTDLFFVNGADVRSLRKERPEFRNRLFRNNGDLTFSDVTDKAGVAGEGYCMAAAAADYDNDGRTDLFVAGVTATSYTGTAATGRSRTSPRKPASAAPIRTAQALDHLPPAGSTTTTTAGSISSSSTTARGTPTTEPVCGTAPDTAPTATRTYYEACRTRSSATTATAPSPTSPTQSGIARALGKGMGVAFADLRRRRLHRRLRRQRHHSAISCSATTATGRSRRSGSKPASPSPTTARPSRAWAPTSATSTTTAGPTLSSRRSRRDLPAVPEPRRTASSRTRP